MVFVFSFVDVVFIIFLNIFGKLMNIMTLVDALNVAAQSSERKDELTDSNSQLKHHINDLRASICALKEILISCSHKAEIAENMKLHPGTG